MNNTEIWGNMPHIPFYGININMTYIADKSQIQPRLYDLWKKNLEFKTALKCKVGKHIQKFFEEELTTNVLIIQDEEIHDLLINLKKSYPNKNAAWFLRRVSEELTKENVSVYFFEHTESTGDGWYLGVEFNATLQSNINM